MATRWNSLISWTFSICGIEKPICIDSLWYSLVHWRNCIHTWHQHTESQQRWLHEHIRSSEHFDWTHQNDAQCTDTWLDQMNQQHTIEKDYSGDSLISMNFAPQNSIQFNFRPHISTFVSFCIFDYPQSWSHQNFECDTTKNARDSPFFVGFWYYFGIWGSTKSDLGTSYLLYTEYLWTVQILSFWDRFHYLMLFQIDTKHDDTLILSRSDDRAQEARIVQCPIVHMTTVMLTNWGAGALSTDFNWQKYCISFFWIRIHCNIIHFTCQYAIKMDTIRNISRFVANFLLKKPNQEATKKNLFSELIIRFISLKKTTASAIASAIASASASEIFVTFLWLFICYFICSVFCAKSTLDTCDRTLNIVTLNIFNIRYNNKCGDNVNKLRQTNVKPLSRATRIENLKQFFS